jgi:DNA-binding response OmpR family regulator
MKQPPDLVILDLMLPNVSGFDILQKIRKMKRQRNLKLLYFQTLAKKLILKNVLI